MKRRFAAALALATLFGAAAKAQETPATTPVSDTFEGQCITQSGDPVNFEYSDTRAFRVARSIVHHKRGPLVQLSPTYFNAATPLLPQRFFAAHECAHHSLGHIAFIMNQAAQNQPIYAQDIQRMELEADCLAASNIRSRYGYSSEEIAQLFRNAPESDRFTHFDNDVREENVRQCLLRPSAP